jgi:hypothetical protein
MNLYALSMWIAKQSINQTNKRRKQNEAKGTSTPSHVAHNSGGNI